MKMPTIFGQRDPLAALEAEATKRVSRIGRLEVELATAGSDVAARTAALDDAVAAALDTGDGAEKAARQRTALAGAQELMRSISGSLDRERASLAETEARLSAARMAADRERAATETEARCSAVEEAAARLDAPVAALAKAFKALLPEIEAAFAGTGAKPEAIAATILAEALAHRMPEAFDFVNASRTLGALPGSGLLRGSIRSDGQITRHSLAPAAKAASAGDFARTTMASARTRAASMRSGDAALPRPHEPKGPVEPEFRADPGMLLVMLAKPIKYRDRHGDEVVRIAGQTQLPTAVAEVAIRRGLAHRANTPAADQVAERVAVARRAEGTPVPDARTAVDLGVNLSDVVAADIAQQRAKWRAAQGLKADAA